MKRRVLLFAAAVFFAGVLPVASLADMELTAEKDGAFFRIVVPDDWNGELVIWGHGFSLSPLEEPVDLGPLADIQLAQGYAVAASSYSQVGWALFRTVRDYRNLIKIFRKNFGKPKQILLNGASLGGIVTAQAVEQRPGGARFAGAYPICGAMAGSRNLDGGLDLRLIYDAVCDGVPGAAIPGGPEGLPADSTLTPTDLALAVNQCTGALTPPAFRTPEQVARRAKILTTTTLPNDEFLLIVMGFATFGLSDLTHDPGKLRGRIGVGNKHVDYGDADINAGIQRVRPHRGAKRRLVRHFTPRGRVHGTKIVSIHTDKDGLVLLENETEYGQVVPASQLTTAVVVEDVPSHCGFTEAEAVAGWESLRGWVAGLPKPTAASIQDLCQGLEGVGMASGPCRINPAFELQDLDTRIPPRVNVGDHDDGNSDSDWD